MNIHDSGYKKLFSNKTIFRELIQTFVDEPWVADLDFEQAETIDKSFISEHYKETESDLIYRVGLHGREVYIYILLEFQSTVDRFMAMRVLNYISNFYMDYLASERNVGKLPAVFPIVLYNGDRRWRAPVQIAELIEQTPSLGRYALRFEYFKIAENEFSREQLLGIRNIVSTLFLTESHYDKNLLAAELLGLFEREEDKESISLLLNWFRQLYEHGRVSPEEYEALETTYRSIEEARTMLVTALEKEREEIRKEGFEQGIEQGIEQGEQARNREIVRAMYAKGFDIAVIADVIGLTMDEVSALLTDDEETTEE
jgi:predicted transposase/invertase (TIGR01784 family)